MGRGGEFLEELLYFSAGIDFRERYSKLERIRKEGAGKVMDEGREDGGKERERRGVSRRGVGDDESVRRRDADRSSSARSQLDGGKHERMTLEHVYVSRR